VAVSASHFIAATYRVHKDHHRLAFWVPSNLVSETGAIVAIGSKWTGITCGSSSGAGASSSASASTSTPYVWILLEKIQVRLMVQCTFWSGKYGTSFCKESLIFSLYGNIGDFLTVTLTFKIKVRRSSVFASKNAMVTCLSMTWPSFLLIQPQLNFWLFF
jgi:hypothetical protein